MTLQADNEMIDRRFEQVIYRLRTHQGVVSDHDIRAHSGWICSWVSDWAEYRRVAGPRVRAALSAAEQLGLREATPTGERPSG